MGGALGSCHANELPIDFGRYRLHELLGEGGMGRVFGAQLQGPAGFRREVALKVLRSENASEQRRAWMIKEARVGALLDHPNIVSIHELGETGGELFIVMERVDDLEEQLRHLPIVYAYFYTHY